MDQTFFKGLVDIIETTYTKCKYTDLLRIYTFDLVKFRKQKKFDLNNPIHRLGIFFSKKHVKEELFQEVLKMDAKIRRVDENIGKILEDEQTRHEYEFVEMMKKQYEAELHHSKEEGIEIGKEQGKKEEKFKIALKMIDIDLSLANISRITGLSEEKLQKLSIIK